MTSHHRIIGSTFPAFLMAGLLMIALPGRNAAARSTGEQDFDANCATCHGTDGKGQGEGLYVIPNIKPPDLTVLSRNNGGVFPTERVYKSIDGRNGIPSHDRFDMPFWGTTFQHEGQEFTPASEAEVRARIMNIVDYVKSIQQK
jgi:mono/diheme cytochrome c family protein